MRWTDLHRSLLPSALAHRDFLSLNLASAFSPRAAWIVALIAFLVYTSTMARDVTWSNYGADGGELIAASMTLGVAHPPGYPLYILIGRVFGQLPFGTVAARYTLLSALAGAAAIGLAVKCMTMRRSTIRSRIDRPAFFLALAIGLSFTVTPLIWGQAIIAEVYTLNLLLVALFVWSILAERSPVFIGLTFGLAVSGHLTGLLLFPLALWRVGKSGLPRFAYGAALGLVPFLLLPLLAASGSPVAWGEFDSLGDWWWLVSGSLYRPNLLGLPLSMWPERFVAWLNPDVLVPVIIWLFIAASTVWRTRRGLDRRPLALLVTAALYVVYAFTNRPQDSAVLLLPAVLLAAIIIGRGPVHVIGWKIWLLPPIMLVLALMVRPIPDDDSPRSTALAELTQVPANALVLTPGDETFSTLSYLRYVENVRPDIIVVDENMFQFDWYRARKAREHPNLWFPVVDELEQFIFHNRSQRSVCWLTFSSQSSPTCIQASKLGTPID